MSEKPNTLEVNLNDLVKGFSAFVVKEKRKSYWYGAATTMLIWGAMEIANIMGRHGL